MGLFSRKKTEETCGDPGKATLSDGTVVPIKTRVDGIEMDATRLETVSAWRCRKVCIRQD